MMEKALLKYNFYTESNTPLMVEAIPMGMDKMTVIVTKVTDDNEDDLAQDFLPGAQNNRNFRRPDILRDLGKSNNASSKDKSRLKWDVKLYYVFDDLDTVLKAVSYLEKTDIDSALFKYKLEYILAINPEILSDEEIEDMEMVLYEFSKVLDMPDGHDVFLKEHGETIVKENAVHILANL